MNQPNNCYTYQWKKDGTDFAGLNDTIVTIDSTGSYLVVAIVGNDTLISQAVNVFVQICTGVNDVEEQIIFTMYPNPTTNQLFIETNGVAVTEINIYNTLGNLVSQTKQQLNNYIDVSQLARGVYVTEIKTKGASAQRRWVKM